MVKKFLSILLTCFSSSKVLEFHTKNCRAINHIKSVLLTEEGAEISF